MILVGLIGVLSLRVVAWRRKNVYFVEVGSGRRRVVFEFGSAELAGQLVAKALDTRRVGELLGFAFVARSVGERGAVKGREAGGEAANP